MKTRLFCLKFAVLVLVFTFVNPETQASQALSRWGTKALNKAATWGAIVMFSTTTITGNILAQDISQPVVQVAQAQSANITELPADSGIPLYDAVRQLDYAQLKARLEAGEVDVSARDEKGNTGLHIVIQEELYDFRDNALLKLVLAHGTDAKQKNHKGKTALSYLKETAAAVGYGEREYYLPLAILAQATLDLDFSIGEGDFAMHDALGWNSYLDGIKQARVQVAEGADVKMPYLVYSWVLRWNKPLPAAAILVLDRDRFLDIVEAEGGIEQVVQERGEYLLKLAIRWGNKAAVEALLDHGVDPSLGIFDASHVHRQGMTKIEFTYSDWEDAQDLYRLMRRGGGTIIIDADDPQHEILNLLIARGADVNTRHKRGYSPLHLAAEAGEPIAMETLLQQGAKLNDVDRFGRTPLHWLAKRSAWVSFEMITMLLARGADVNMTDDDVTRGDHRGHTPYHYVIDQHNKGWTRVVPSAAAAAALILKQGGALDRGTREKATQLAELSGNETIKQIVAGEIEITQLLDRATRQRVVAELHQAGIELEKAEE